MIDQMVGPNAKSFIVRPAEVTELAPLRHSVLRSGLPVNEAYFPGDELPSTFHAGAFDQHNLCVGCATLHLSSWDSKPAFQLRGMAVADGFRGCGVGSELLKFLEDHAREKKIRVLWCNGRTPAIPFYEKQGWRRVGDEFMVPTAGPHFKLFKEI